MANNTAFYDIGVHVGEITGQGFTKASTGTLQFLLNVKILGVPASDPNTFEPHRAQYTRTLYMALTAKTVEFVKESLKRVGFEGRPSDLDPAKEGHTSLVGKQVMLWCNHEQAQGGGVREKWSISNGGAGAREYDPLPAKEMRELDALFGRAKSSATRPPVARVEDESQITDDDIPF